MNAHCVKLLKKYKKKLLNLENTKLDLHKYKNYKEDYIWEKNFLIKELDNMLKYSEEYNDTILGIKSLEKDISENEKIQVDIMDTIKKFEEDYKKAYDEYILRCQKYIIRRRFLENKK